MVFGVSQKLQSICVPCGGLGTKRRNVRFAKQLSNKMHCIFCFVQIEILAASTSTKRIFFGLVAQGNKAENRFIPEYEDPCQRDFLIGPKI